MVRPVRRKHSLKARFYWICPVLTNFVVIGEDAMPATVSTRRALLQTGPALLGKKPLATCYLTYCVVNIMTTALAANFHFHFGMTCRHAFDAASNTCPGCWVQKGT